MDQKMANLFPKEVVLAFFLKEACDLGGFTVTPLFSGLILDVAIQMEIPSAPVAFAFTYKERDVVRVAFVGDKVDENFGYAF